MTNAQALLQSAWLGDAVSVKKSINVKNIEHQRDYDKLCLLTLPPSSPSLPPSLPSLPPSLPSPPSLLPSLLSPSLPPSLPPH